MKRTPAILLVVGVVLAVTAAIAGFIFWQRYRQDRDALREQADIRVSPLQRAMTLRFINKADEDELEAAGIRAPQRDLILEHRPLRSLAEFSEITGIGQETIRSAIGATRG
jgi:hypothetical protein